MDHVVTATRAADESYLVPRRILPRKLLDFVVLGGESVAVKGTDTGDSGAAAFRERNDWERAGADAASARMVDDGYENEKELTKRQLDNQKDMAEMQNKNQKKIAAIQ